MTNRQAWAVTGAAGVLAIALAGGTAALTSASAQEQNDSADSTVINPHCDGTVNVDGTYPVAPEGATRWFWTVNGIPGSAVDEDGDLMGYHFVVDYGPVLAENDITVWYLDNNQERVEFNESWTCDVPDPDPTPTDPPTDEPTPTDTPSETSAPPSDPAEPSEPSDPQQPSEKSPGGRTQPKHEPPEVRQSCGPDRCVTEKTEPDGSTTTHEETFPSDAVEEGF